MSKNTFPREIQPLKLANKGERLQGSVALSEMQRLRVLLAEASGNADFSLEFGKDEDGFCFITGQIKADLTMTCQRCWHPFLLLLVAEVHLSPVDDDKAADQLPSRYEPLLCKHGVVLMSTLLEDELLLQLPLVPKHSEGECTAGVLSD
jgi:uncharacterized protein